MSSPDARETRAFASEIKFLVPRSLGAGIREWARRHLDPDPHGSGPSADEYTISTIYLDTPEFDVFHKRRSYGRSKYRIRRYDNAGEVFLERKLRQPGVLSKRRTIVPASWLAHLEEPEAVGGTGAWFHRRMMLRKLQPACQIAYFRMARVGETAAGPVRLTLDDRLEAAPVRLASFDGGGTLVQLMSDAMILELKYRRDVPAVFKRLVEEFALRPQPLSKYRLGVAAIDPEVARRGSAAPPEQDTVSGLPCG